MNNHLNVIKNISLVYIVTYGLYYTTHDILSYLPVSICLISAIIAMPYFGRVPAPPKELVEQILGKSLHESDENDTGIKMRSVGHRGVALDAPENTLEGFKLCLENGMKFVEFDVMITQDNVPVVIHDANLERLADLPDKVRDMTYDNLMQVDVGRKHAYGNKYTDVHVPTLEAVVTQLLNDGQNMFIDLKVYDSNIVEAIMRLYKDFPALYSRAVVSSFSPLTIYQIRRKDPKIVCGLAYKATFFGGLLCGCSCNYPSKIFRQLWAKMLDGIYYWALESFIYYLIGISAILVQKDAISEMMINDWQHRNVRVIAWTVNSRVEKQYFANILRIPYLTDTITAENSTHAMQCSK